MLNHQMLLVNKVFKHIKFDKVVKLTVNQQVQGMTSEKVKFRDLLLRLRKGDSTVDD